MIPFLDSRCNWDDTVFVSLPGLFQLFLSISHVYASLGKKKSTQVLCPFFNQVTWEGLLLSCMNSLYILGIRLSSNTCLPSIFSPSIYCLFILFMISFAVWNFLFNAVIFILGFVVCTFGVIFKTNAKINSKELFLSLCFLPEVLQFQVLQLSVSSVLSSFSWTWQKVAVQYSQHHLIKRLLFVHCIFSAA